MRSLINRPVGRETDLRFEAVSEHARLLSDQGRETMTELNAVRARVEASLEEAEQTVLRATAAVRRASEQLRAIRDSSAA
jgi:ElaB/YqjD/DUF883 family membrane-anchored ribosome-binding protein